MIARITACSQGVYSATVLGVAVESVLIDINLVLMGINLILIKDCRIVEINISQYAFIYN